ncbi:MAG: replicative DNA helicase [Eubacterium sp.]|nr:replicative DNA helicase [Eubacterium sp.]
MSNASGRGTSQNIPAVKRVMPHDDHAEKAVIGSMLMDREAIADLADMLLPEDFYNAAHGVIFEAICELYSSKKMVDIVTLMDRLAKKNIPEEVNNVSFIGDLINAVPTAVNAKGYGEIVRDKAVLRRLIKITDEISKDCYIAQDTVENILERAEQDVFKLSQSRNGYTDFANMSDIVLEVIQSVDKAAKNKGRVNGLSTGFIDLDEKLTGLHGGELILVAARPSMGKTAFVLNIAHNVAVKQHIPVLFFSLEMGKKELGDRVMAQDALVDAQAMKTGNLADEDWSKLAESAGTVGDSPIFVDDNSSITIAEMRSKCRKFKQKSDIGLIIVDYLQLMSPNKAVESRQQFVSEVSRSLKGLARELNVPVIALSQLNRAVDSRPDHKPVLADLRESGAIEQDADVVMFIYRDEYYNKETEKPGIAEIIVAKQRNGSTGSVDLIWQGKYTRFANCAR